MFGPVLMEEFRECKMLRESSYRGATQNAPVVGAGNVNSAAQALCGSDGVPGKIQASFPNYKTINNSMGLQQKYGKDTRTKIMCYTIALYLIVHRVIVPTCFSSTAVISAFFAVRLCVLQSTGLNTDFKNGLFTGFSNSGSASHECGRRLAVR